MAQPSSYQLDLSLDLTYEPPHAGMVAIYGLFDPRDGGIRYIGRTVHPETRLKQHLGKHWRHGRFRTRWIDRLCRLGLTPSLRVLLWVRPDDWIAAEKACIAAARAQGLRLTNATDGGDLPPPGTSEQGRRLWQNPAYRARHSAASRAARADPRYRAARSRLSKALWQDPLVRDKMMAANRAIGQNEHTRALHSAMARERWRDPAYRQRVRESKVRAWADPARRSAHGQRIKAALRDPAVRAVTAETMRACWRDPAWRANLLATRAAAQERVTPEAKADLSAKRKQLWADPDYRSRMLAARAEAQARRKAPAHP